MKNSYLYQNQLKLVWCLITKHVPLSLSRFGLGVKESVQTLILSTHIHMLTNSLCCRQIQCLIWAISPLHISDHIHSLLSLPPLVICISFLLSFLSLYLSPVHELVTSLHSVEHPSFFFSGSHPSTSSIITPSLPVSLSAPPSVNTEATKLEAQSFFWHNTPSLPCFLSLTLYIPPSSHSSLGWLDGMRDEAWGVVLKAVGVKGKLSSKQHAPAAKFCCCNVTDTRKDGGGKREGRGWLESKLLQCSSDLCPVCLTSLPSLPLPSLLPLVTLTLTHRLITIFIIIIKSLMPLSEGSRDGLQTSTPLTPHPPWLLHPPSLSPLRWRVWYSG